MLDNPIVCKDSEYLAVWTYILLNATHKEHPSVFKGNKIMLKPGQLITGRKTISEKFKISESKVQRILKLFESEQQIEQQNGNKNRLITILSWDDYQGAEQQDEREMNNKRTTTEQQLNTYKNVKKEKNEKKEDKYKELIVEIVNYLNTATNKNYSSDTKETIKLISGRLTEGRTIEQFKHVIDVKTEEWLGNEKMERCLKPNTLFAQSNFESYMNQKRVIRGGGNGAKYQGVPQGVRYGENKTKGGFDEAGWQSLIVGSPQVRM
jgi:uncharacterized phage protein (TIGR02220 family)